MAIYWETPDKHPLREGEPKYYYKAEIDKLGRLCLCARKGTKGKWGWCKVWDMDRAFEALITELEAREREFNERMDMISKPRRKHAYPTRKP